MYEELVKLARYCAEKDACINCPVGGCQGTTGIMNHLADAIEERDRYALTLQHEMMAEAESHIAQVERLNKQIEELQKNVAYWQAQLTKSMCGETLAELERPRWVSVAERLPEEGETILDATFSVDVLGFDGWNYRRAYYNYTAKVWLNGNDEQEWPEITHWMPISKDGLPEPPKEEKE